MCSEQKHRTRDGRKRAPKGTTKAKTISFFAFARVRRSGIETQDVRKRAYDGK